MKVDLVWLGILLSYAINFTLLYHRKRSPKSTVCRYILTLALFIIGLTLLIYFIKSRDHYAEIFFFWCLMTPFLFNTLEIVFNRISQLVNKRDFYLWLRNSSEINDSLFARNPHITWLDRVISMLLLICIVLLPIVFRL